MTNLLANFQNGDLETSEPIDLPEGTQLLITVNLAQETEDWTDEGWSEFSFQGLNRAYCDSEPDYNDLESKEYIRESLHLPEDESKK